jgi:MFS family permease
MTVETSAVAIASTRAISGAVAIPLPVVIGWLLDRLDRKHLLALCYLLGFAGLLVLPVSASLWHSWLVLSLMRLSSSVGSAVGGALVADLVPPEALGKGMSLFSATTWVGGIIGFAVTSIANRTMAPFPSSWVGQSCPWSPSSCWH